MKFNFKIQDYQTDAVKAITDVFQGQGFGNGCKYRRDLGKIEKDIYGKELPIFNQSTLKFHDEDNALTDTFAAEDTIDTCDETGYRNDEVILEDNALLENIRKVQQLGNIKESGHLIKNFGRCSLDVEMETGTGKTYVYIKTMFELNKLYGWSKFIVVVPSVAIREGVKKSFEMTMDHFMEHYSKKTRFFVYNSANLNQLDTFSSSSGINVMIINTQAFASSLKEGAKNKESRIIYSKRDEFQSRKPIDVIKANRPIMILDEPQKMGGEVTQKAIKNFNPLFALSYSATHAKQNNLIYVLDALEAYNQKLVKKIEVKGFEIKNLKGTNQYLYLEDIVISKKKPPMARMELEVAHKSGIKREIHILGVDDNLFYISKEMEQYKGYTISEIDPTSATVSFTNGIMIAKGDVLGDISEQDMRRIQIRETVLSHFEKEEKLFNMGIKTLSLFFIDEVAKYRGYDENGNETLGEYGRIFEEEYLSVFNENITVFDTPYQRYLKENCFDVTSIHKGYFSIDKKTGRSINSETKRGAEFSDDISAYDLILKNKERLLSFDEPTRFIFSHSALREGWDNPNVFTICTLKHSESQTAKRQEVGRGLRLCVNADGHRMDKQTLSDSVHEVNKLTVVASESYKTFVTDLQSDIKAVLYDRPTKATVDYFLGKTIMLEQQPVTLNEQQAKRIYKYLIKNDYIDDNDGITEKYREDLENETIAPLPEEMESITEGVHIVIRAIFDESVLDKMFEDANKTKIIKNDLNGNFKKKQFQELWSQINHKYAYTVSFDGNELIQKAIVHIDSELFVSRVQYTTTTASQKDEISAHEIERGDSFDKTRTNTQTLQRTQTSNVRYDLVGKIAKGTSLTRQDIVEILKGIREDKILMFRNNPEEFITKVIRLINEQKSTMVVEHISYNRISGEYEEDIFTAEKNSEVFEKAYRADKHIQDYVFTDGTADKSKERKFAENLDSAEEVCVYAKLPRGFKIPTPMGDYSPDWAIAFHEGTVKHIYFVAETKGTMESLSLRPIEKAKISCARKLFNEISTETVRYHDVDNYDNLLNVMESIK